MTSVLIAFAIGVLPPPVQDSQRSIWLQLDVKRTGNNGYEEYLDAVDEYRKSGIDALMSDQAKTERRTPTYLQLSRMISERMVPIIAKLQQGNQKPVYDPMTDFSTETWLPQLSQFKNMTRAISSSSDAKFANGATSAAISEILTGLEFGDNAGRGPLVSGLLAAANHAVLFRTLHRHWGQLSGPDAIRLEKYVNNYFVKPNAAAQVFQFDFRFSAKILRTEIGRSDAKGLTGLLGVVAGEDSRGDDAAHLIKEWESATPVQRAQVAERVAKRFELRNQVYQAMFVKPEKEWQAPEPEKLAGLEGILEAMFTPYYQQAVNSSIKHRTQLRLLRLHAIIRQYRFEHDRLPESLAKLNKPLEILDPVTGESFMYEPKADLQYELYGKGNSGTGRIDLLYRREPGAEKADPNAPPQ